MYKETNISTFCSMQHPSACIDIFLQAIEAGSIEGTKVNFGVRILGPLK